MTLTWPGGTSAGAVWHVADAAEAVPQWYRGRRPPVPTGNAGSSVHLGEADLPGGVDHELTSLLLRRPRLDIEAVLADAVVAQALRSPEKAPPASRPGSLLAAHLAGPGHGGASPAFRGGAARTAD
ncbi:hypothetical protein ACFVY9_26755 [Streptomyces sp. NPDC059544]|uniref:hypothetical protein n=1 Tax=Streptomyces sp. NPDC059544 TaxID=3346861 RepID=UPI003682B928